MIPEKLLCLETRLFGVFALADGAGEHRRPGLGQLFVVELLGIEVHLEYESIVLGRPFDLNTTLRMSNLNRSSTNKPNGKFCDP